jgi:hypothetical protein
VVNVAALVTADKDDLDELIGQVPGLSHARRRRGLLTSPSSVKTKLPETASPQKALLAPVLGGSLACT